MSIRAEDRPKAFEAQFLSASGKLSEYGDFDFKPGAIVRKCRLSEVSGYSQQMNSLNVFLFQGNFKMRLKAQRMIDDISVCKTTQAEKQGTMRVKPTTFNKAVTVNAHVFCPTCDCEKVDIHSHQWAAKVKKKMRQ